MVSEALSPTERAVSLERHLRWVQGFLRDLLLWGELSGRRAQVEEEIASIERTLTAHGDDHLLARVDLLERCAVTMHRLDSEGDVPAILRELAGTIERVRGVLDGSGYDEWNLLSGIGERP